MADAREGGETNTHADGETVNVGLKTSGVGKSC
jgi:hypothetical protein